MAVRILQKQWEDGVWGAGCLLGAITCKGGGGSTFWEGEAELPAPWQTSMDPAGKRFHSAVPCVS